MTKNRIACLACLAAVMAAGAVPSAHHFYSAIYFEGQRLTLEGVVVRWSFVNPHAELALDVRGGPMTGEWTVEWDGALHLARTGVTPGTIATGQRLVVTGSPGRAPGTRRLRLRTLVRPMDGWSWPPPAASP